MKVVPATAEDIIEQYPEFSDGGTVKNLKGPQVPLPIGDDNRALENLLKEDISENTLNGSHQQSP